MAKKKSAPAKLPASPRPKKVTAKPKGAAATKKPQVPAPVAKPAAPVGKVAQPVAPTAPGIHSWHSLQEALRNATSSKQVQEIMKAEIAGPARLRWMLRIQGRLQTLRNDEELTLIESIARG